MSSRGCINLSMCIQNKSLTTEAKAKKNPKPPCSVVASYVISSGGKWVEPMLNIPTSLLLVLKFTKETSAGIFPGTNLLARIPNSIASE